MSSRRIEDTDRDGSIYQIRFLNDKDEYHNENGPVIERFYTDGTIYRSYLINGGWHNDKGPARIWYNNDGTIFMVEYWINYIKYSEENYYAKLNHLEVFE